MINFTNYSLFYSQALTLFSHIRQQYPEMYANIVSTPAFTKTSSAIRSTLGSVIPFLGLTILLASSHWFLVRGYATYCAPPSLSGLIYTWFSTGSPVCQFINHLQVGLANNFVAIWAAAAAAMVLWVASRLTSAKSSLNTSTESVPMATTNRD